MKSFDVAVFPGDGLGPEVTTVAESGPAGSSVAATTSVVAVGVRVWSPPAAGAVQASVAVGGEIRLPTGEEENYLGTGALGIKPYFIYSRRGRLTQNINVGYQWNGSSALFTDPTTGEKLRLPSSLMYSGGLDFRVVKQFTLTGEYLGQMVFSGPRLRLTNVSIPGSADPFKTVETFTGSYLMNNLGVGFKVNPFKGLLISASALIKLDNAGLRSKVVPLLGASYRF